MADFDADPINLFVIEDDEFKGPVFELLVSDLEEARGYLLENGCKILRWRGKGQDCYIQYPYGVIYNLWETRVFHGMIMEPEEFLKRYKSALATQDWEIISPLIHKNACVTFSNGHVFRGKEAVQGAFEKNFSLIQDEHYAISDIYWVKKTGEIAVCLYTFNWSGLIQGEPASGSGRGTSVLANEEGKWFLLTEHLGPNAK